MLFRSSSSQAASVAKRADADAHLTLADPDLSANGANFPVAIQGVFGLVYGTSASAPVVASWVHPALNDALTEC